MANLDSQIRITDQLVFYPEKGTLLLSLEPPFAALAATTKYAEEHNLIRKKEFHITLIGFKYGQPLAALLRNTSSQKRAQYIDVISQIVTHFDWKCVPVNEYYLIEKEYQFHNKPTEQRHSIIQKYDVPDQSALYDILRSDLSIQLPEPFSHVTLYTNSTNPDTASMGIGINASDELQTLNPIKLAI